MAAWRKSKVANINRRMAKAAVLHHLLSRGGTRASAQANARIIVGIVIDETINKRISIKRVGIKNRKRRYRVNDKNREAYRKSISAAGGRKGAKAGENRAAACRPLRRAGVAKKKWAIE